MTDPSAPSSPNAADSPADIPARTWKEILIATWKDAGNDNLDLIAAGVGFYAFLAFVPLLTTFVLSYGLVADPAAVVQHIHTLTNLLPQDAAALIGEQLQSMAQTDDARTGVALVLAIAIAIYGASKGAGSVITALNIAFEVEETRSFFRRTLLALTMTAGAVIVLFLAILAISALNFLETLLPELGGASGVLFKAISFLLAASAVILLLAVIYRYGPNRPEAKWKWITPGSALATLVWLIATIGFGLYVANFGDYNATYGLLGAVIVFMTWLYLSAYAALFGAELNAILELQVGREKVREREASPAPDPVSASAGADPPSLGRLIGRLGFFSALAGLLGRPRRIYR